MSNPIVPLAISPESPDSGAVLESLVTPHPPGSENIGGAYPASDPGPVPPIESDAAKLNRATPGRKKQLVSKHRSKSELLTASRELEKRTQELEGKLARYEGGPGPSAEGMTASELSKAVDTALDATIELGSNIAAAYYGDHWVIPADERTILRDAWAPIARMYAPRAGQALPWIGALSCTALVILPRVNKTRDLMKEKAGQPVAPISQPVTVGEPEPAKLEPVRGARYSGTGPV